MSIHSTACISSEALVDSSASIGPYCVIEGPVQIGPDCSLGPFVHITGDAEIGAGCTIHAHASIGDLPQDHKYDGTQSFCRVGEGCTIREGVTIHRASQPGEATVVGAGSYLMTNSHVGHDSVLAEEVTLISGALLGGHVSIGRKAIISGNAAIHQFVRIGELAMVGGLSKVVQDVPPYTMTGRDGSIAGLNTIGLVRANLSPDERKEIKAIYKLFYRAGLSAERAMQQARELVATEPGQRLLGFFESGSSLRGLRKGTERRRAS